MSLNNLISLFYFSRVKGNLVGTSAICVVVSTNLTCIIVSRLILSNNQSSATLCVRETCLIVGLVPLMIILFTASLSSKTNNNASWRGSFSLGGTKVNLFC